MLNTIYVYVIQDFYHKMIELSSEARIAYEVMLSNLEQTNAEEELQTCTLAEKIKTSSEDTQPEEPEYSKYETLAAIHKLYPKCVREICVLCVFFFLVKMWNKIFEKDNSNKLLNLEEQLSFLHLESECTETTIDEES